MDCDLELLTERTGRWIHICKNCGSEIISRQHNPKSLRVTCLHSETYILPKVRQYTRSVLRWIAAGSPTRSKNETSRIYSNICVVCEEFNKKGSCNKCGCRISRDGAALNNKIRMATESCPLGKW